MAIATQMHILFAGVKFELLDDSETMQCLNFSPFWQQKLFSVLYAKLVQIMDEAASKEAKQDSTSDLDLYFEQISTGQNRNNIALPTSSQSNHAVIAASLTLLQCIVNIKPTSTALAVVDSSKLVDLIVRTLRQVSKQTCTDCVLVSVLLKSLGLLFNPDNKLLDTVVEHLDSIVSFLLQVSKLNKLLYY